MIQYNFKWNHLTEGHLTAYTVVIFSHSCLARGRTQKWPFSRMVNCYSFIGFSHPSVFQVCQPNLLFPILISMFVWCVDLLLRFARQCKISGLFFLLEVHKTASKIRNWFSIIVCRLLHSAYATGICMWTSQDFIFNLGGWHCTWVDDSCLSGGNCLFLHNWNGGNGGGGRAEIPVANTSLFTDPSNGHWTTSS